MKEMKDDDSFAQVPGAHKLSLRIVDVNVNRAAEGLRVLEDYAKFGLGDREKTEALRTFRHAVRKHMPREAAAQRLAHKDLGYEISVSSALDHKEDLTQLLLANEARVQEAIRVLEEHYKILGLRGQSKAMEAVRHGLYRLQLAVEAVEGGEAVEPAVPPLPPVPGVQSIPHFSESPALPIRGLYALTSENTKAGLLEAVERFERAGVTWVQYRDKTSDKSLQIEMAVYLRELTQERGMKLIVNDDVSLAILCGADGVHVGQGDLPVREVKRLLSQMALHQMQHDNSQTFVIGISTHNQKQFEEALKAGPSYIAIGPIYGTTSKADVEACEGVSFARWARAQTDLPLVAIGGIDPVGLVELAKMGIDGFAMISGLSDEDRAQAAKAALESY